MTILIVTYRQAEDTFFPTNGQNFKILQKVIKKCNIFAIVKVSPGS